MPNREPSAANHDCILASPFISRSMVSRERDWSPTGGSCDAARLSYSVIIPVRKAFNSSFLFSTLTSFVGAWHVQSQFCGASPKALTVCIPNRSANVRADNQRFRRATEVMLSTRDVVRDSLTQSYSHRLPAVIKWKNSFLLHHIVNQKTGSFASFEQQSYSRQPRHQLRCRSCLHGSVVTLAEMRIVASTWRSHARGAVLCEDRALTTFFLEMG